MPIEYWIITGVVTVVILSVLLLKALKDRAYWQTLAAARERDNKTKDEKINQLQVQLVAKNMAGQKRLGNAKAAAIKCLFDPWNWASTSYRADHNLTQEKLAIHLGVNASTTINDIVREKTYADVAPLKDTRIALEVLGIG